jgi:hypothetical protein
MLPLAANKVKHVLHNLTIHPLHIYPPHIASSGTSEEESMAEKLQELINL